MRIIFFDLDGVMMNTQPLVEAAYLAAGVRMPRQAFGSPAHHWLDQQCAISNKSIKQVRMLKKKFYRYLIANCAPEHLLCGPQLLHHYAQMGYYVSILTGASLDGASVVLDKCKIDCQLLGGHGMSWLNKKEYIQSVLQEHPEAVAIYIDDNFALGKRVVPGISKRCDFVLFHNMYEYMTTVIERSFRRLCNPEKYRS